MDDFMPKVDLSQSGVAEALDDEEAMAGVRDELHRQAKSQRREERRAFWSSLETWQKAGGIAVSVAGFIASVMVIIDFAIRYAPRP